MSKTFQDTAGREWLIDINVASLTRVKNSSLAVDLMEVVSGSELLRRLARDCVLLVNVIYVLIKPQLDQHDPPISDEQFGAAMGGTSLDAANDAFMEALTDFFPQRQREALKQVLAKAKDLETRVIEKRTEILNGTKIDQLMERELAKSESRIDQLLSDQLLSSDLPQTGHGSSSGNSPASAASIQAT